MPIIGLTDRTPSFKELGRLRLGIPKKEAETSGPREISYFRPDFRPDAGEAVNKFTTIYGDKPTRINVRFPFNEINRIWDAYYMVYNKSGLLGMSDGQRWLYLRNNQTGELLVKDGMPQTINDNLPTDSNGLPYLPFDKSIPVYSYKSRKGEDVAVYAKPEGRLKILVPELKQAAYMTVITHSVYNVMRISEQLAGIEQIARNAGMSLPLVPVVLSRRKELISVSIDGKKSMQEHYLLNVEIDPDWMEAQFKFLNAILPGVSPLPMKLALPAWTDDAVHLEDLSEDETGEELPALPIEAGDADREENEEPDYSQVTNSDGILYSAIPVEKLAFMATSMEKALKKGDYTPDKKAEIEIKLAAAKFYMAKKAA